MSGEYLNLNFLKCFINEGFTVPLSLALEMVLLSTSISLAKSDNSNSLSNKKAIILNLYIFTLS